MDDLRAPGETVLERLRELPGGPELLSLAASNDDVELVGGATRDLLLGRTPRELDVVLSADAVSFARELALQLGLPAEGAVGNSADRFGIAHHERFGTALVWWDSGRIDIACRRAEFYPAPGALPEVRPGTPEEDLRRRDFTVNTIAVRLGGARRGALSAVSSALEDLAAARLRVLHEQSFLDDPTRLLRLARYRSRLGFDPEAHTAELAAQALASGALQTVSRARLGAELRLTLAEPDPVAGLLALAELQVLTALGPGLDVNEPLLRGALELLPADGRTDLLSLATLLLSVDYPAAGSPESTMRELLDDLEFTAADRERVVRTALGSPILVAGLEAARTPSAVSEAVDDATPETIALAGSLGEGRGLTAAPANARRWLSELRHVRLQITGDDLIAAGVSAGPEIGERLERTLRRKLNGELEDSREGELTAALRGPRPIATRHR